jgi:AcrR family transcriptional regulator
MYVKRRRDARKETRTRIIGAVRDLLTEGKFHESTVEEIAERAGVSRATLYQHFGSRPGLVDALCETFDATPALVAVRKTDDLDEFIGKVVDFWASEEKILVQLYGVAAVDPAARDLVARQWQDRHNEISRLLRARGLTEPGAFHALSVLTSFETFEELRRHNRLPKGEVAATLQAAAHCLLDRP